MCYKQEQQKRIALQMEEKYNELPPFIRSYFLTLDSEKTKRAYFGKIKHLLEWLISNYHDVNGKQVKIIERDSIIEILPADMKNVKGSDIMQYLNDLSMGKCGKVNQPTTIRNKKDVLGSLWSYMFKEKIVDDNVVGHINNKRYKTKNPVVEIASDKDIEKFKINIEKLKNEFTVIRNLAIVELFLGSGIRIEELVGLDLDDLHLEEDDPYIEVMRKGEFDENVSVLITERAADVMRDYLIHRKFKVKDDNIQAVFISNRNQRINDGSIRSFFNKCSNGKIHPHLLRDTFATRFNEATNYNTKEVAEQLGHKSTEITYRRYIAPNMQARRAALGNMS